MLRRLAALQSPQLQQQLPTSIQHASQQLLLSSAATQPRQLQQTAWYSQRMTPQQVQKKQKQEKKQRQQETASTSSAGADATSFAEDTQVLEADVTKLVLQAIQNVTPVMDVRPIRTATKVNYVPGLMPPKKARSLALHWLVKAADARAKNSRAGYAECLALELLLAYQKKGAARQKRDDIHKLALQNRANVHLRWW